MISNRRPWTRSNINSRQKIKMSTIDNTTLDVQQKYRSIKDHSVWDATKIWLHTRTLSSSRQCKLQSAWGNNPPRIYWKGNSGSCAKCRNQHWCQSRAIRSACQIKTLGGSPCLLMNVMCSIFWDLWSWLSQGLKFMDGRPPFEILASLLSLCDWKSGNRPGRDPAVLKAEFEVARDQSCLNHFKLRYQQQNLKTSVNAGQFSEVRQWVPDDLQNKNDMRRIKSGSGLLCWRRQNLGGTNSRSENHWGDRNLPFRCKTEVTNWASRLLIPARTGRNKKSAFRHNGKISKSKNM